MKRNHAVLLAIAVAVVVICLMLALTVYMYKPFRLAENGCVTYYKECTCIGSLLVLESYPPQYRCEGLEFCNDIDVTECG